MWHRRLRRLHPPRPAWLRIAKFSCRSSGCVHRARCPVSGRREHAASLYKYRAVYVLGRQGVSRRPKTLGSERSDTRKAQSRSAVATLPAAQQSDFRNRTTDYRRRGSSGVEAIRATSSSTTTSSWLFRTVRQKLGVLARVSPAEITATFCSNLAFFEVPRSRVSPRGVRAVRRARKPVRCDRASERFRVAREAHSGARPESKRP
jgi:hypothetical protein